MIKKLFFILSLLLFFNLVPFSTQAATLKSVLTPTNSNSGIGSSIYSIASTTVTDLIIPLKCYTYGGSEKEFGNLIVTKLSFNPYTKTDIASLWYQKSCLTSADRDTYSNITFDIPDTNLQGNEALYGYWTSTTSLHTLYSGYTSSITNDNFYRDDLTTTYTTHTHYLSLADTTWGFNGSTSTIPTSCLECESCGSATSTECKPIFLGSNHIDLVNKYIYLVLFVCLFGIIYLSNKYEYA